MVRLSPQWIASLLWLALLAGALCMDVAVARWVHDVKPAHSFGASRLLMWWMGHFLCTLIVAGLLIVWHPNGWQGAILLLSAAAFSGATTSLLKWTVGRTRPFKGAAAFHLEPFSGGCAAAIHGRPNLTFPSGHASLAFATAAALHELLPRRSRLFFALAVGVAAFRVLEGAHYPSDAVAGAAVGVGSARVAAFICRRRKAQDFPSRVASASALVTS